LNYLYLSTDKLTVGTWQLGPRNIRSPDLHAGDEVYYVLDGVLTEHNPVLGEFMQVRKGEALLLPMHGSQGHNSSKDYGGFSTSLPENLESQYPPWTFSAGKMKQYKGQA